MRLFKPRVSLTVECPLVAADDATSLNMLEGQLLQQQTFV